jgi:hypothetical protein
VHRNTSAFIILALACSPVATGLAAKEFVVEQKADRLAISHGGKPVAEYVFRDEKILRPFLANVHAPAGSKVTRNHPPIVGQDATDHDTMHPGLWLAFSDISGQDFWRNKARIEHVRFIEEPTAKQGRLTFATELRLRTTNGAPLCSLTNRFELLALTSARLLVWDAVFSADAGDITFGDQEEMAFGARVATRITEKNGALITNSAGLKSAKHTWGHPADWCDYSGAVAGQELGITLMASPANFRPCRRHNRDYGLMVANPFGREAMKQGSRSTLTVKHGESFRLRFATAIHQGNSAQPASLYESYLKHVAESR